MKGYFIYDAYWTRVLGLALFSVRLLHDPLGEVKQILDRLKPAKQAVSTDKLKIKPKE